MRRATYIYTIKTGTVKTGTVPSVSIAHRRGLSLFLNVIFFIALAFGAHCEAESIESKIVDKPKGERIARGALVLEIKRGVIDMGDGRGVVPKENVFIKSDSLNKLNEKYRLLSVERLFSGTRSDNPSDIYVFRFSEDADVSELSLAYKQNEDVIYAEPDYAVYAQ